MSRRLYRLELIISALFYFVFISQPISRVIYSMGCLKWTAIITVIALSLSAVVLQWANSTDIKSEVYTRVYMEFCLCIDSPATENYYL